MLSDRLASLRFSKNLTHQEIADVLGITRQAYSNYEAGKREPDYNTLVKLANYFNVTTDYLLGKSDVKRKLESIDEIEKKIDSGVDPISKIFFALPNESELIILREIRKRENLQKLFEKVKDFDDETLSKIIRVIEAME